MDAKQLIQVAWVAEVAFLLLLFTVLLFGWPNLLGNFFAALPLLSALIGGQGLIAAMGPEIKRLIESKKVGG